MKFLSFLLLLSALVHAQEIPLPPAAEPDAADEAAPLPPNVIEQLETFIESRKATGRINVEAPGWRTRLPRFPGVQFAAGGTYRWHLETTEGTLVAELLPEIAPEHVRNTIYLSLLGFYDGLNFHRIIPGFMAQGACPIGTGTGNPGYTLPLEVNPEVRHRGPGILSMARSQAPNSAGSQFFITFGDTPNLDNQYSIFGRVVEGLDVVRAMETAGNPNPRANGVPPRRNILINRAWVTWTPDPAP